MAQNAYAPLTVSFRDCKGLTSKTRILFHFNNNGANAGTYFTNFVAALDAMSNAAIEGYTGPSGALSAAVAYGTAATYRDIADKAVLAYQTARGDIHRFQVPAPLSALFLPDGRTIDPANAAVVAFNVYMLTVVSTDFQPTNRDGDVFSIFLGGYRRRGPEPRKTNIFTKDANLTAQEPEGV